MPLHLVFNELSSQPPAEELHAGIRWMAGFSELLLYEHRSPISKKTLVVPRRFAQIQIAAGYSIGRWLADVNDEPTRVRMKLLFDRSLEFESVQDSLLYDDADEADFRFGGTEAIGLSIAHQLSGIALSFLSDRSWDTAYLDLEKSWITHGDVETTTLTVPHASELAHFETHRSLMERHVRPEPTTGKELLELRSDLFPSLDFCESAAEQIRQLAGTEHRFKVLRRSLGELQTYCSNWTMPYFDIKKLNKASGESELTLRNYSEERTFVCPDGQRRVFQWHLKRGPTRIHFYDFPQLRRILVGYVGNHLRVWTE
jgi:hypothetical protein